MQISSQTSKRLIIACVGIGTFIASLNSSLITTILPVIRQTLKISLGQSDWLVLIFLLIMTVSLIPFGKLSDLLGHRLIFLTGFALFTCAAFICGCSANFISLFIGRALMGFGSAMILSVGPAILTTTFPSEQRGKVLGLQALMAYAGLSFGPLIGGSITQLFGWKFAFFINLPFGLAGLLLGIFVMPKEFVKDTKSFDVRGMIFFAIAMTSGTLLLNSSSIASNRNIVLPLLFVLLIFAFWQFMIAEHKASAPMIKLSLFQIRDFGFGSLGAASNYLIFYLILFAIPNYLEAILHSPSIQTGVLITITPLVMVVCSPIVGSLSDRFGSRIFSMMGMFFSTLSLVLFAIMTLTTALPAFILLISGLICTGLGIGIFAAPNNSAIMGATSQIYQGVASGVVATFRNIGMIAGTTLGGTLFDLIYGQISRNGASSHRNFLSAFSMVMWIAVIFGILGFICSSYMSKKELLNHK